MKGDPHRNGSKWHQVRTNLFWTRFSWLHQNTCHIIPMNRGWDLPQATECSTNIKVAAASSPSQPGACFHAEPALEKREPGSRERHVLGEVARPPPDQCAVVSLGTLVSPPPLSGERAPLWCFRLCSPGARRGGNKARDTPAFPSTTNPWGKPLLPHSPSPACWGKKAAGVVALRKERRAAVF